MQTTDRVPSDILRVTIFMSRRSSSGIYDWNQGGNFNSRRTANELVTERPGGPFCFQATLSLHFVTLSVLCVGACF